MANKSIGYVVGTVGFYGKTTKPNSEEKQYCLRIDSPEFKNFDLEALKEQYKAKQLPANVKSILAGEKFEKIYFNSDYPITKVWIAPDKHEKEFKNPELTGIKVMMAWNKNYIGALLCEKEPDEYTPNPFNMEDFDADFDQDELPFN